MRSVNYSRLMEKTVDRARKEPQADTPKEEKAKDGKHKEDTDKCWINALNTCVNQ